MAEDQGLGCRFILADVRDEDFGNGFDLVMMIFGQLNVFPRNRAMEILRKAHAALEPGGCLLLEVQTFPSLSGKPATVETDLPVVIARR